MGHPQARRIHLHLQHNVPPVSPAEAASADAAAAAQQAGLPTTREHVLGIAASAELQYVLETTAAAGKPYRPCAATNIAKVRKTSDGWVCRRWVELSYDEALCDARVVVGD